jgi:AraC-like DNA-binding protein
MQTFLLDCPSDILGRNAGFRDAICMDVLSEVLKAVKLQGALFFNGEFSAPWCFRSSLTPEAQKMLAPDGGHVIIYHYLTEGTAYARLPEGRREELVAGDIVIFPHGDVHFLGNGSPENPVDSFKLFAKHLSHGLKVARYGNGGDLTKFVCGFMACEPRLSEVFLAGLPEMFKVHVPQEPSGQWLANSIQFSVGETNTSNAGSGLVMAKLSELLFVETLRRYINTLPTDQVGWLAGARDAEIGHALALLHKDPAQQWTVASLARQSGLSRTVLADRFTHFLNESPIAYLTKWRMKLGAEFLQSTEDSVAEIAASVGYGSEAAFNRAFKREFSSPPAQFRRKRKTTQTRRTRSR